MLMARKGYRVLLVDRATFPSDSMRNHYIRKDGVASLHRWGLLDRVEATGCPPVRTFTSYFGDFPLTGTAPVGHGVGAEYAPRRYILDKLLLDAAAEAGAEVREGFSVSALLSEGDRVTGIRGKSKGGQIVEERARIVIGADGQHSLVARTVNAPVYNERPALSCGYYSYWSNLPCAGQELFIHDRTMLLLFPTNGGLTCAAVQRPISDFPTFRTDIEGHFMKMVDTIAPEIGERLRGGHRDERFLGTGDLPNFFRKPHGPGWALVGDAGFHKDPITARGISDAFRDAELLTESLDAAFSGRASLEGELEEYEQKRNTAATPSYQEACMVASFPRMPREMYEMRARLRGNQDLIDKMVGIGVGSVTRDEFDAAVAAAGAPA
jgi:flavin-dependent dehydrogenase